MDGGRIGSAISPYMNVVGLFGGGALIYADVIHNPIIYLIMASGAYSTISRFYYMNKPRDVSNDSDDDTGRSNERDQEYYNIGRENQMKLMAYYIMLVGGLFGAMSINNKNRKSPKQLQMSENSAFYHEKVDFYDDFTEDKF
jgi:hypothetical protein